MRFIVPSKFPSDRMKKTIGIDYYYYYFYFYYYYYSTTGTTTTTSTLKFCLGLWVEHHLFLLPLAAAAAVT